ncbi:MAG: 16S rRNA (cytosine(1402)-N(4))-methyltransferase RsmH [Muribaculaceae bacterium]|nr:16S rRNA (cytosine(1402)-N(4))-methyltransferase RsmH [Muribaculaceae bacterium]
MNQDVYHIPALLPQTLEALDIKPCGVYVDATYGGGGHSRAIVERLGPDGHLYGFDQDEDAIAGAMDDPRFTMVYGNFRFMANFLRYYQAGLADGILADLGVSFHHFDDSERGFSFRADARLDMRMNRHAALSARDVVNDYSEEKLADILYLYGEVQKSRQIAKAIVKARGATPINTINELLAVVEPFVDRRKEKKDLACIFQALRIEVNGELDALREFLNQTAAVLRPGGRLAIITYHSLEDRLVKNFMRAGNFTGQVEKDLFGRADVPFKLLGSKPIVASDAEVEANPRSRSAKLRVAVRLNQDKK